MLDKDFLSIYYSLQDDLDSYETLIANEILAMAKNMGYRPEYDKLEDYDHFWIELATVNSLPTVKAYFDYYKYQDSQQDQFFIPLNYFFDENYIELEKKRKEEILAKEKEAKLLAKKKETELQERYEWEQYQVLKQKFEGPKAAT